ncbi:DUF397 domain-containing protein [Amycolatopsis cihanbeyliensis]|uniref:Uncharacterized protein DUF397 n=1 Tax=Amycolatopsis cihanbeyliensis TaxID=1128664 RepID=A0A542CUT1_AMYCI|nr:DUF397 domain-containing protein [Amycolatopsis cihanbeyliensis]TQI94576.1 uncharacterized protein DUF397 [Amycolatopsis cihanbeyliensis]
MSATPSPRFAERDFRKATRSDPDKNCVCVARRDGWVELRDSKTAFGAADDHRLVFTAEEFDAYLAGARAGETDGLRLEVVGRADGKYVFRRRGGVVQLVFTAGEVAAFQDGIAKREFDTAAYAAA